MLVAYGIFVAVLVAASHGDESLLVLLGPLAVIGPWTILLLLPRAAVTTGAEIASEAAS